MANKKYTIREDINLLKNFSIFEFACNEDNELYISYDFIYVFLPALQRFRNWYNRPININSCYRTTRVNDKYGGSKGSVHKKAMAIDFNYPDEFYKFDINRKEEFLNNVKNEWIKICRQSCMYYQVNFYDNRFHLGMSKISDSFIDYR